MKRLGQSITVLLGLVIHATFLAVVVTAVSLPNPLHDPLACRSDNTTYRICDRDGILPHSGRQAVQKEIQVFETYNVTCGSDQVVPVQMGVALIRTMHVPFGANLPTAARQWAEDTHKAWGVGYPTASCGSTGLLLFLAVDDHQIYMSRGKALSTVLTSDRLQYVIDKMKPHLRDGQYQEGLSLGVQLLTAYISGQRPGFEETMEAVTTLLGILAAFCACMGCMACIDKCHRRRDQRLRQELRNDLARLDRDRALALQGKYKSATSCPICLEDFDDPMDSTMATTTTSTNGESLPLVRTKDKDGEALKLLNCGHTYHQSCWNDFTNHPATGQSTDGGLKCPICRLPVEETLSSRDMAPTLDDTAYQPERHFRLERLQEMYPTFIGTQYIDQWYDPDYRGSLLDDYDTMERERQQAIEQAEAERNRMFSYDSEDSPPPEFGGGKPDGGGVGDTF